MVGIPPHHQPEGDHPMTTTDTTTVDLRADD